MENKNYNPVLTREMINEDYKVHFSGSKGALVMLAIMVVIFALLSIWKIYLLFVSGVFLFMFVIALARFWGCRKKDNYYIVEDICVGMRKTNENELPVHYYLFFRNFGKHKLINYSSDYRMSSTSFYDTTNINDGFYLLVINGHRKPSFVYPMKSWKLDSNGFQNRKGKYYPV